MFTEQLCVRPAGIYGQRMCPGAGEKSGDRTDEIPALLELTSQWGETHRKRGEEVNHTAKSSQWAGEGVRADSLRASSPLEAKG